MKKKFAISAFIVVLGALFVIFKLNSLVALDETCKANWAQVLNQYQRRAELVPNLVSVVKAYATHEQDALSQVIEARAKATQTTISADMLTDEAAMTAFMQNQNALSSALSRLMVSVERYPDLKANENFMGLQSQLEGTDNRIAVARQGYIDSVKDFNTSIRSIPTKWIASLFSDMKVKAEFTIEESQQVVPVVDFSK